MSQQMNKIVFIAFLIVGGCGYDNTTLQAQEGLGNGAGNGSTAALDFAKIKTDIIQKSCSGCHTDGGARGGVTLDTYAATKAKLTTIWSEVSRGQMPPSGPLPPSLVAELKQWIDEGALETAGATPPAPEPTLPVDVVDFARVQKEIFSTKCAGCHTEGGARGGVVLDSYSTTKPKIKSIWKEVSKGDMPLAGPLEPALVELLKRWVDAGAPEKVGPPSSFQAISVLVPQVECNQEYRDKLSDGRFVDIDGQIFFDEIDQSLKRHPEGCEL